MIPRLSFARAGVGHGPFPASGEALQWLMVARLGVLFLLLLTAVLQQIFLASSSTPGLLIGYGLLACAFAFNAVTSALSDGIRARWSTAIGHVLFDTVLISIWIFFSGGKENLYSLLYLVQILSVALILYQRAAFVAALAASVSFGVVLLLDTPEGAWLVWGLNVSLFLLLGLVGGYLSEELYRTTVRLEEKSQRVEKLIALQERIISNMPTGLLTVDAQLRIGFLNPSASSILGLSSEQAAGQELAAVAPGLLPFFDQIQTELVEGEAVANSRDPHHRMFVMGGHPDKAPSRLQQVVEFDSGTRKRILRGDVAALEGAEAGGLLHAEATEGRVLLFQDVTKLLNLEERLKQNEKLAAVGQLAAGIAHEIRNPLAGMSASIEMLRSSLPRELVGAEDQKLMDIALREIDRLNQLISEFLDYVKPQKLKFEPVDLSRQISDILVALRNPEKPGRIKSLKGGIVVRTDIELKETYGKDSVALANPEKLKQVIWNLIINAIQAMDKTGVVEVGCGMEGPHRVKFWVQDQGQGMSESTLSHLYEPFFTTKEKGTGLGLATAYKIVEALGGEIRVESAVGKGTRFEVLLPAAQGTGKIS